MDKLNEMRKALVAAAIVFFTQLVEVLDDDRITGKEWAGVGLATFLALSFVWGVPNAVPAVKGKMRKKLQEGYTYPDFVVVVLALLVGGVIGYLLGKA